ncbi:hypothetical protein MUK42_26768 [Musa troglodytarum]|uniref:Cytochrome c domain-containing protein n=1 Tax=Musa troglodytarum TaxID=320322 RepID=A0A9E7EX77_9LILI|nr:hypothetical protein MUK42_26768 [Musa troglodytarum]
MEGSFDDDDLPLPRSQSVSPVSKPKLWRLKKAGQSGPRDIPTAGPVLSPSRAHAVEAPTMAATPASEESVPGSHVMETEMGPEPVLDPLFPDLARREPNYLEIEREKQGFDWGGESGSAGVQGAKGGYEDAKSAKKRLNSEEEGETTRQYKKNKSGEKPKESAREKRRLDKEREAELVRIHAESQRLLRETSNVSFTPSTMVRIPIPPLLEKIRQRKRELLEKYGYFNRPESANDSTSNKVDICHDFDLTRPENGRGDDEHLKENEFPHDRSLDVGEIGSIPTDCENDLHNQATNPNSEDANQTLNTDKEVISNHSDQSGEHNQLVYTTNALKDTLLSLPTSTPKLVSTDVFQENEEDDESDDDDVVNDLIATDFKEAPIDHESRNLLHQKWVEQQDTAATDNFLQRLRCGQKQKEPTFFHEEEGNEEFSEKSEEEESYNLPRTNAARKNAKLARQMVAQMYTDDQDAYVSSDDEEIERALTRQRLLRQNEESTFISLVDNGDSREFFGLIKKVNNASEPKKREKTITSDFDRLLMRGSSNSSSKDQMEKQHRKPSSAKFNGSQVKSTSTSKTEVDTSSGVLPARTMRQPLCLVSTCCNSSCCFRPKDWLKRREAAPLRQEQGGGTPGGVMERVATPLVAATAILALSAPAAYGQSISNGAALFQKACIGCHDMGGNILQPGATLFMKDLQRNGVATEEGIYDITYYGKGRMPASSLLLPLYCLQLKHE